MVTVNIRETNALDKIVTKYIIKVTNITLIMTNNKIIVHIFDENILSNTIMKTIVFIASLILSTSFVFGQNYIGMSQIKIIKKFGTPDEKVNNYFIYYDKSEGGTNTYYFDQNNKCNAFVITRDSNYLKDYQKMLSDDFTKISEYLYIFESDRFNFKAEISQSNKEFNIRITPFEQNALSCYNPATSNY